MEHKDKNEKLVELGDSYIDKTRKVCVWRRGPAPEFQIIYLQLMKSSGSLRPKINCSAW